MGGKEVIFPNELLEEMKIESTFFSPVDDNVGIAALSHLENNQHVLRLYHLLRNNNLKYHPVQELAAFSFVAYEELIDFLKRLPQMSGFEMLLLLNPLPQSPQSKNVFFQ